MLKQGWLLKKSRHMGSWRRRWVVLTEDNLSTYHNHYHYQASTETISLSSISSITSISDTIFQITTSNATTFEFNSQLESNDKKSDAQTKKNEWIEDINKYKHHCINMPVTIECARNNDFDFNFELVIPYDQKYDYTINILLKDILKFINTKLAPFKFIITQVQANSFIGLELNNDFTLVANENVTEYAADTVTQAGIHLQIDLDIYQHKPISFELLCPDMMTKDDLCPIYGEMRYQDKFTENMLNHLYEYQHPDDTECKYGDECYAYRRLEKGGNELNDRCHITIYTHPPRDRARGRGREIAQGINSFSLNDEWAENVPLYRPTGIEKKDGCLNCFLTEIINNGYKSDLCLCDDDLKNDEYTLMNIVDSKLNCMRHKKMGCPLNRSEMLSLILYTGGDSNYELCKEQRNGEYEKWKWFDYCLYNAIIKLSKREYGCYKIYTGLSSTNLPHKYVEIGYFKTYVSTSWVREIAETFTDDTGMIFEINETFRQDAICCDVSWISKFGLNECEILIARSIDAVLNSFE
eukprot:495703_1